MMATIDIVPVLFTEIEGQGEQRAWPGGHGSEGAGLGAGRPLGSPGSDGSPAA